MEILTQSNNQVRFETAFDKAARENYFKMLEVAIRNLSIIDLKKEDQRVLVQE